MSLLTGNGSIVTNDNRRRHMNIFMKALFGSIALAAIAMAGGAAHAVLDNGDLLETLERGLWRLRHAPGTASALPVSQYCLGDATILAQLRHSNATCSQNVLRSTANSLTISYSCGGKGQGITVIRKETDRLIQIQSQGIWNSSPFSFTAEARRISAC